LEDKPVPDPKIALTPFKLYSYEELCARAEQQRAATTARRKWGPWRLYTRTWELALKKPGVAYAVDLERIGNSAGALDWIAQVNGKSWITPADIGHLVRALDDIFNLQSTLCGLGRDRQIKPTAFLKRRYAKAAA
jgi:hypothetical protein